MKTIIANKKKNWYMYSYIYEKIMISGKNYYKYKNIYINSFSSSREGALDPGKIKLYNTGIFLEKIKHLLNILALSWVS